MNCKNQFNLHRHIQFPLLRIGALWLALLQIVSPLDVIGQQFSSPVNAEYKKIGEIQPRNAKDIKSSNWSIGAETADRDYIIYKNFKQHLAPLGFKKVRLQAGWARTEKEKGVYNWDWLDEMVFGIAMDGMEPWMNLSYGNAIYAGGGGTTLFAQVPKSGDAKVAWDKWARATVDRYKSVIDEWEIWNEPNYRVPAADYAELLTRTAAIVKSVQPKGKVLAFCLGSGVDYRYADSVLTIVAAQNKIHLIDEVTFHRHQFIPEDYTNVEKLDSVVNKYSSKIRIRQGESGAPSKRQKTRALHSYDWTEHSASKWALRRLLGDLGRQIETSYFGIMEMQYPDELNAKGLLKAREDLTVERPKETYFALQHLASVFDDNLKGLKDYKYQVKGDSSVSIFAYEQKRIKEQVVTLWLNNGIPANGDTLVHIDLNLPDSNISNPVYVDLNSGEIFAIPVASYTRKGKNLSFRQIPIYDSPVLIADRSILFMKAQSGGTINKW